MFGKLKSKQFEALLEKAVEAEWAKPLAEIAVPDKRMTADELQATILRFRRG